MDGTGPQGGRTRRVWVGALLLAVAVGLAVAMLQHSAQYRYGIIGGVPVSGAVLPGLAYVRVLRPHSVTECTGTLVAEGAVLTAAHCVESRQSGQTALATSVRVLVGRLIYGDARQAGGEVAQIVVFPGYRRQVSIGDAALLIMRHAVTTKPVSLAGPTTRFGATAARPELLGWATGDLVARAVLDDDFVRPEKVIAPTVVQPQARCEEWVANFDPMEEMCAIGFPTYHTGACSGDSGGPLVAQTDSGLVEIGLVSKGAVGCKTRRPTVFTRIAAIHSWITAEIERARCGYGSHEGCRT